MYKAHKIIIILVFIVTLILPNFGELFSLNITESLIENIITFLSIAFGFNLTAISTLYGRDYIKKMNNQIDPIIKTQTKLHTIKNYFSNSCIWALVAITYLISFTIFKFGEIKYILFGLEIKLILVNLILSFFVINIIMLLLLLKFFLKGLVEETNN